MALTPDTLARIALDAGQEIMRIYRTEFSVDTKDDKSPLTEADGRAEALILARLAEADPDLKVIAEESVAGGRVLQLDGAPLLYGKRARGYDNPDFVVYGDVSPA